MQPCAAEVCPLPGFVAQCLFWTDVLRHPSSFLEGSWKFDFEKDLNSGCTDVIVGYSEMRQDPVALAPPLKGMQEVLRANLSGTCPVFILDRRAASKDAPTSAKLLRKCCISLHLNVIECRSWISEASGLHLFQPTENMSEASSRWSEGSRAGLHLPLPTLGDCLSRAVVHERRCRKELP